MLHSSDAQDWLKTGLCEAILVLCKSGLKFQSQFSVDGLLAVTIDQNEVLLINIKEIVSHSSTEPLSAGSFAKYNTENSFARSSSSGGRLNNQNSNSRKSIAKRRLNDKDRLRPKDEITESGSVLDASIMPSIEENQAIRDSLSTQDSFDVNNEEFGGGNIKCRNFRKIFLSDDHHNQRDSAEISSDKDSKNLESLELMDSSGPTDVQDNLQRRLIGLHDGNLCANEDRAEFDLSRVKVEREDEDPNIMHISSGNFFHQTFQGQDQSSNMLYDNWFIPADRLLQDRNQVNSNSGQVKVARCRSRKPSQFQLDGPVRYAAQHSSQRRTTREGCCENCGTRKTTAWRRSDLKELLCNACGCYYKLHKVHRPLHMAHNEIKSRCRRSKQVESLASVLMTSSDPLYYHLIDASNNGSVQLNSSLSAGNHLGQSLAQEVVNQQHNAVS